MKWLEILAVESDVSGRYREIAIGLYNEPPQIDGSNHEEPEVFHIVISNSQIRMLQKALEVK